MLIIKSKGNYINIQEIASRAGIDRELISLRRAEGDGRLWRAWLSNEIKDIGKTEKELLWQLICDGHEAVIMENNKRWRQAIK